MEALIKMVAQKVGISEDQAKTAVQTVLGFIKDKVPAPIASQIDNALKGGGGDAGDTLKDLGGKFGK